MKKIFFLILVVTSLMACSDPPCFELTPDQKEWLPYKEGDTIKFVSSDGVDSIAYIVSKHLIEEKGVSKVGRLKDVACITSSFFDLRRSTTNTEHLDSPWVIFAKSFNYGSKYYINIDGSRGFNTDSVFLKSNLEQQNIKLNNGKKYEVNIVFFEERKIMEEGTLFLYYVAYNKEKGIIAFKITNRPDIQFELTE